MYRPYAKPLVLLSPKYLFHHKPCESPLSELTTGTYFRRVIIEGSSSDNMSHKTLIVQTNKDIPVQVENKLVLVTAEITRVVFCSGKVG